MTPSLHHEVMTMGFLDKQALVQAAKLKKVEVEIDGGSVLVSEVTQESYEAILADPANKDGDAQDWFKTMTALIAVSVVNEDGSRMFGDEDKPLIAGFSREVRNAITNACLRANGFSEDEKKPSEPTGDGSPIGA